VHPAAAANVLRTTEILRAEAEVLEEVLATELGGRADIEIARVAALPPALARLAVIRLAEDAAGEPVAGVGGRGAELIALASAGGSAQLDVGGGVRAVVEYGVLRFARHSDGAAAALPAAALPVPGAVAFGAWRLSCAVEAAGDDAPARARGGGNVGVLDAERLGSSVLEVRPWRAGDRIRPLGLSGSKALSDLFADRRVPRAQRETLPVLVCDGEIAWIPGVATAQRFRVDPSTRRIVVLRAVRPTLSR
jgi:tRNA(Ile)-lysidine synthase